MNIFKIKFPPMFCCVMVLNLLIGSIGIAALKQQQSTVVAYFGLVKAKEFEQKIKPLFLENSKSCPSCEIVNYTPYTSSGDVDWEELKDRLEELPSHVSFLYFDFNLKVNENVKSVAEILNKKVNSGLVIVGAAGAPQSDESSSPLSRTLLGQIRGALIIGELEDRDRLTPTGFYGPEMLTAIKAPKDLNGKGLAPLLFAAELAENWQKRSSSEWGEYLRTKKMKTRKIWMDLNDIF